SDVPQHVANRNDADRQAIFQDRQMAILAHVHLVQGEGQRVRGCHGFGVRSHELFDQELGIWLLKADYFGKEIALTENAEELAVVTHNQQGADVAVEHDIDRFAYCAGGTNGDGLLRLQHTDGIFHQTALDARVSNRPIELSQVHQAVATLFAARQVVVAAVRTDHAFSSVVRSPWSVVRSLF